MSKNDLNGDYWMSGIAGQVFRINKQGHMQYCFARLASSPFEVHYPSMTDNKIVFCYQTGERMNSHKANATGCDAANIVLEIQDGILELTFHMSPPIKHAWIQFKRRGAAPPVSYYKVTNLFGSCDPENPPPPTLLESSSHNQLANMCPIVTKRNELGSTTAPMISNVERTASTQCHQLGTFLGGLITKEAVNIRLQYNEPTLRCWPCKISYSVSAEIEEHQYISVGFKGMGYRFYEGMLPSKKDKGLPRPNYFGMATDPIDETRTGSVMVTAYATDTDGGCVREMKAENYVGTPKDVTGNPHLFKPSVERKNGRTIVRFAVEQHVGRNPVEINNFLHLEQDSQRIMWAIGDVRTSVPGPPAPSPSAGQFICKVCDHIYDPDADGEGMAFSDLPDSWLCPVCGQPKHVYDPVSLAGSARQPQGKCKEQIMGHQHGQRGVSPLEWFEQHPRCKFDALEFGHSIDDHDANISAWTVV